MRITKNMFNLGFLPFALAFFIFLSVCVYSLATEHMEAFKPESLFESVRAQLEQCKTKADVQLRFGPPKSSVASGKDFTLYFWDWAAFCMVMDWTNVCSGFTICVSNKDDVLYSWAPAWFGSVPKDIPALFGTKGPAPEQDMKLKDKEALYVHTPHE